MSEEQTDGRVDNHVCPDVLQLAILVDKMTEHGMHQLMSDEAEQVCRVRGVLLDERRVVPHDATSIDAGCGTVLVLAYSRDEGCNEAVPAECASNYFSDRLQIDLHGIFPLV